MDESLSCPWNSLNLDCITHILLRVSLCDILALSLTCKGVYKSVNDDRSQMEMCLKRWKNSTDVSAWKDAIGSKIPGEAVYLHVHRLLHMLEPFIGPWRSVESKAQVYTITWGAGELLVHRVICSQRKLHNPKPQLHKSPLGFKIGPRSPHVRATLVNDHIVIKVVRGSCSEGSSFGLSGQGTVADAVESASISLSPAVKGTSPPNSFSAHFASFMSSSVQRRRSEIKAGSSLAGAASQFLDTHVWRRLRQMPFKNQPLAGLWYGLWPTYSAGPFILSLRYDTSKNRAHIVGAIETDCDFAEDQKEKEHSDLFMVSASPLSASQKEQLLIDSRQDLVLDSRRRRLGLPGLDDDPLAFLQLGGDSDDDRNPEDKEGEGEGRVQHRRVISVFSGKGKMNDVWVEGRLWVYDNSDFGFVFLSNESGNTIIDFKRWDWEA